MGSDQQILLINTTRAEREENPESISLQSLNQLVKLHNLRYL